MRPACPRKNLIARRFRTRLFVQGLEAPLFVNKMETPDAFVKLYVVPDCPLCAHARGWLKEHGVTYTERDVATDFGALRAMYELTHQRFVPVLEAKGRVLVRPTETELMELLL